MRKLLFAAAAIAIALYGPAGAQTSDQGTPNSEHGSGDMMQDGPHAAAAPESASPSSLPTGRATSSAYGDDKMSVCSGKWKQAVAQGTTAGRSKHDFIDACMSQH